MELKDFKIQIFPAKDKLYRLANRLLGNPDEAEDSVQDVFLKLWDIRKTLSPVSNPEAFAMKMMKNLCIDKLKAARNRNQPLGDFDMPSAAPSPDRIAENTDTGEKIGLIVDSLPDTQKLLFHLREIEQMEYDEIEKITGLARGAIKTNLSRTRKKIREQLITRYNYEYK